VNTLLLREPYGGEIPPPNGSFTFCRTSQQLLNIPAQEIEECHSFRPATPASRRNRSGYVQQRQIHVQGAKFADGANSNTIDEANLKRSSTEAGFKK
jgi:hypothetical protein